MNQNNRGEPTPFKTGIQSTEKQLLWNTKTACHVLGGISPRTLRRFEQRGFIKSVMLTRHKLYAPEDVQRLAEEVRSWPF